MGAFSDTRKYFIYFTHYDHPLSFEDWSKLPDEYKAATLFVQFYKEIYTAYKVTEHSCTDECESVGIVNQHLIKNVPIIMANSQKFTSPYIYTIAYNSMGSINNGLRSRDKMQELETSNYYIKDSEELDLFDSPIPSISAEVH